MSKSPKNWKNLFDLADSTELSELPSELWYLQVIEIVISLENEHYLVLEYPFYSYSDVSNNEIKECIWSAPYTGSKLDIGAKRLRKVQQIKSEYNSYITANKDFLKKLLEYKLYTMGLGNYTLAEKGEFLEYKQSLREPNKWKCYYIKRYALTDLDQFDLYNIVDPECLKGYTYLCIERHQNLMINDTINATYYFKGKPLASNTATLFLNGGINALIQDTNKITKEFLTYKEKGLLFSFDLISFGKNQETINDTFLTLNRSGSEIADDFEFLLNNVLGEALNANNYNQYRLMGDGFIAASPIRHNILHKTETDENVINDQIKKSIIILQDTLKAIKKIAPNLPSDFSCRSSLIYDEYFYGKIGGLICDKADIAGRSILKIERLQGIINSWFEENDCKKSGYIYLAVEKEFYNKHLTAFQDLAPDEVSEYSGNYKEFNGSITILTKKIKYDN